jgi:tetratricopeptide (TPR) repeat protein
MRPFAAFIIAAAALAATPAYAQSGWGMSEPIAGHVGELSPLSPTHRYWDACRSDDVEAAAHACGRVIGARVSRLHTGSAHYFRALALASLGDSERALRDLRRAYGIFAQALDADENNANALYGRGLTLIRMGYPADGEADIARATALSEGRASQFFDASF